MGRLLGWQLTRLGHSVTVYEQASRSAPQSAAHVAAAMLAPMSELPDAEPQVYELGLRSLQLWPALLQELDVPFGMDGSIFVAHGTDGPLLDKFYRSADRKAPESGMRWITGAQIAELEPELKFQRGLWIPNEGWLDNRGLLAALESVCGEIVYNTPVDPQNLSADLVIDCRGTGSSDPQLRAVRGEVARVHAPEVSLSRPVRLMHPRYQIYIAPRVDHHYVIGATQLESEANHGMTVRSALELLSAAFTVHSGFAEAEITELSAGLRPAYADHQPKIEWQGEVLHINGLFRHGYLMAPALVEQAMNMIESTCSVLLTANR